MEGEPFDGGRAKKLIVKILHEGTFSPSVHADKELAKDDMSDMDVVNVLRAGRIYEPAEFVHGSWRYRVHTPRMTVVVAFRGESEFVIVTGWRKKHR